MRCGINKNATTVPGTKVAKRNNGARHRSCILGSGGRIGSVLLVALLCAGLGFVIAGCGGGGGSSTSVDNKESNSTTPAGTVPKETGKDEASTSPSKPKSSSTTPAKAEPDDVEAASQAAIKAALANNPDLKDLKVLSVKLVGDWGMVVLQPADKSIEAASFLMKKQPTGWVVVEFGTSVLPEDHPDAPPQLFQQTSQ